MNTNHIMLWGLVTQNPEAEENPWKVVDFLASLPKSRQQFYSKELKKEPVSVYWQDFGLHGSFRHVLLLSL